MRSSWNAPIHDGGKHHEKAYVQKTPERLKFPERNKPGQVKFSMKGVNKGQFKNPMPHYEHVLTTKQNFRASNQGIRAKDERMVTYKQNKNALTYFYPTRKVLADGCTTVPLDI